MSLRIGILTTALLLLSSHLHSQSMELPEHIPFPVEALTATEIGRFPAQEAGQGAAADSSSFYAIVNSAIGRYSKKDGRLLASWAQSRSGPVRHLNSCYAENDKLFCSNSNFPEIPMASSIEVFETENLKPVQTLSLGVMEEGSLTWFDHFADGWIAGFAHYDERGGLTYKDHSFASIVHYDKEWRRRGGWMIPESVIERMKPHAASGGAIGRDGLLYLTGHDRGEMYVLAAPIMGPKLEHIATIQIDIEGQAFAFDKSASDTIVYGISRSNKEVRAFTLPPINLPDGLRPLTEVPLSLQP